MAHSLYTNGSYSVDGVEGNIRQLEGRFAFIDQIEKYNNICDSAGKHNAFTLNGREKQYQQFLFYRYFFDVHKPLIVTEGKTDVRYIKAALRSLYADYPDLVEKDAKGKFLYKVDFFKRSKRFKYLFNLALDGADSLTDLYDYFASKGKDKRTNYLAYFLRITQRTPQNPVIFVYDNEIANKNKPLCKFSNHANLNEAQKQSLGKNLFLRLTPCGNLFLLTNPLVEERTESEIEHMFTQETRSIELSGKKLSLASNFDNTRYFGKDHFSNYVLANYSTIDFSGFRPLLNALRTILQEYVKDENEE